MRAKTAAEQLAFLDELEETFGHGRQRASSSVHLQAIIGMVRSTFEALPKTTKGGLSATAARYAIHRLFILRHGWHVKGLAPVANSWVASGPGLGFSDRLPAHLRTLFAKALKDDDNYDLSEVATIAVAIESMIHGEVVGQLSAMFDAMNMDRQSALSQDDAKHVLYLSLIAYLADIDVLQLTRAELDHKRILAEKDHPLWTTAWELIEEVRLESTPNVLQYTFTDMVRILDGVNHRLGERVDEAGCQEIEDKLVRIEDGQGSGRVRLSDFYSSHLASENWQFKHSQEYLRHVGVLDETDPIVPRIIIPNYITMKGNCLNISHLYDLCCIDLCEDLFGQLEEEIKAPMATPEKIVGVINRLPSTYVPEGRNLSQALVHKLAEVAELHGGQVPLHGRLFAQWMHFAYPTECPYPHLSGTKNSMSQAEWSEAMGKEATATHTQMMSVIEAVRNGSSTPACNDSEEGLCMWTPQEELVDAASWRVSQVAQRPSRRHNSSTLRMVAFVVLLGSSLVAMWNLVQQSASTFQAAGSSGDPAAKTSAAFDSIATATSGV